MSEPDHTPTLRRSLRVRAPPAAAAEAEAAPASPTTDRRSSARQRRAAVLPPAGLDDGAADDDDAHVPEFEAKPRTRLRVRRSTPTMPEYILDDNDENYSDGEDGRRAGRSRGSRRTSRARTVVSDDDEEEGEEGDAGAGGLEDDLEDLGSGESGSESESGSEGAEDEGAYGSPRKRRPRARPSRPAKRARPRPRGARTLPLQVLPEDVPWRKPNPQPDADPESIEYEPGVAFIVIYLVTFPEAFEGVAPVGPQEIEEGVSDPTPGIEALFRRLLMLVLNRKKDIEPGRYSSALGELHSLLPHVGLSPRFPTSFQWKSRTAFEELEPLERLDLLHVLAQYSLVASQTIAQLLSRVPSDAIAPWLGSDNENNKFYFVQGNGDTQFRVYKETNRLLTTVSWRPVASTPEEVERLVRELEPQGRAAAKLAQRLEELVPELRESDERRIKELRRARRKQDMEDQLEAVRNGMGYYSQRTRTRTSVFDVREYDRKVNEAIYELNHPPRRSSARAAARELAREEPVVDRAARYSRRNNGEDADEPVMDVDEIERAAKVAAKAAREERARQAAEEERRAQAAKAKAEEERLAAERAEEALQKRKAIEAARREEERRLAPEATPPSNGSNIRDGPSPGPAGPQAQQSLASARGVQGLVSPPSQDARASPQGSQGSLGTQNVQQQGPPAQFQWQQPLPAQIPGQPGMYWQGPPPQWHTPPPQGYPQGPQAFQGHPHYQQQPQPPQAFTYSYPMPQWQPSPQPGTPQGFASGPQGPGPHGLQHSVHQEAPRTAQSPQQLDFAQNSSQQQQQQPTPPGSAQVAPVRPALGQPGPPGQASPAALAPVHTAVSTATPPASGPPSAVRSPEVLQRAPLSALLDSGRASPANGPALPPAQPAAPALAAPAAPAISGNSVPAVAEVPPVERVTQSPLPVIPQASVAAVTEVAPSEAPLRAAAVNMAAAAAAPATVAAPASGQATQGDRAPPAA